MDFTQLKNRKKVSPHTHFQAVFSEVLMEHGGISQKIQYGAQTAKLIDWWDQLLDRRMGIHIV